MKVLATRRWADRDDVDTALSPSDGLQLLANTKSLMSAGVEAFDRAQ